MHRYPGVKPFETTDKELFFGREQVLRDFQELILLEKLTVLFGKSGYGKSSLLNAGILPLFQAATPGSGQDYLPVGIRFGIYVPDKTPAPLEFLRLRLLQVATDEKTQNANTFLNDLPGQDTLWYFFKKLLRPGRERFLLIFDQFEEFFSYPLYQQQIFKQEMAALLYEETPEVVLDAAQKLDRDKRHFLSTPLEIRAVFSIRADRLSLLDSLKDKLPAILHKRYELRALTREQAQEAITYPATLEGPGFDTPPFRYSESTLEHILAELSNSEQTGQRDIELFQLQILCQHIEEQVYRKANAGQVVQPSDLPKIANIFEEYYNEKLSELPHAERVAAHVVIEEGLMFEHPITGEARRLSKDPDELLVTYRRQGVTLSVLQALEKTYLLRREANNLGGFNYEISHDTLLPPIQKARAERQLAEKRSRGQFRRRRTIGIIASTLIIALGALTLSLWALRQRDQAIETQRKVEKALILFEKEQAAKDHLEFAERKQYAINFINGGYCDLAHQTFADMQALAQKHPELVLEMTEFKKYIVQKCPY